MNDDLNGFLHELVEDYFVRRDYAKLMKIVTQDFSFFGTGIKEVGYSSNIGDYFSREMEVYNGKFSVYDECCHVTKVTPNVAVAMVSLTIESDPASGYVIRLPLRFTVVLRREAGAWKLVHVHNSVPYQEQGDETYFNHEVARQNYALVESVARQLAETEVAQARQRDVLTGIMNLEGFVEQVREIICNYPEERFALLKFNVNNFRFINQTHGYGVGDELLQDLAQHLEAACQAHEVCGRVEKDNFAMLMVFRSNEQMDMRMEELRMQLLGADILERVQEVTYSGGIYLVPPGGGESVKKMLDKALLAKQSALRSPGKSYYAYYSSKMDDRQYRLTKLAEQAPMAMQNREFKLYIQPQVDLKTLNVVAGEALVRWIQPDGTIIMPDDFIPTFEKNEFIIRFDFYMLDTLCRQMREWIDQGTVLAPISINQSRQHLRFPDYVDRFCEVVDKYEIPHKYIAFELTESAFIECNDVMLTLARELHRRGFLLAIDDFGTGYASLNLLGQLAADILKIDRSLLLGFDDSPRSKTILRKVVEMAQETQMTTICEGVETMAQLEYLQELGCDIGQGYYFYRPMPAEQFQKELLEATSASAT